MYQTIGSRGLLPIVVRSIWHGFTTSNDKIFALTTILYADTISPAHRPAIHCCFSNNNNNNKSKLWSGTATGAAASSSLFQPLVSPEEGIEKYRYNWKEDGVIQDALVSCTPLSTTTLSRTASSMTELSPARPRLGRPCPGRPGPGRHRPRPCQGRPGLRCPRPVQLVTVLYCASSSRTASSRTAWIWTARVFGRRRWEVSRKRGSSSEIIAANRGLSGTAHIWVVGCETDGIWWSKEEGRWGLREAQIIAAYRG